MNDTSGSEKDGFGHPAGNEERTGRGDGPIVPVSASQALKPEMAPQPPRRSRKARSQVVVFLNFVMSLVLVVAVAAIGLYWYGKTEFEKPGPLEQTTTFEVEKGASFNQIAANLEKHGLITDQRVFKLAGMARLGEDTLKAGEYEIKANASMEQILELIRSGKSILYSFTIPEGLTTYEILARLRAESLLVGELPADLPAEGSLLPETYKYGRGTTRIELIEQMARAHERVLDTIWQNRDEGLPVTTKEELVILASIVEKETGRADERPRVAAVFINRLEKGMRLQSDPTIIYGLFGGKGKPSGRPIYRSDIDKETPYNTYVINGLPPTPIANPGRASMEAVANPSQTDDLFFVADGTGGHAFAETLAEHNDNVARWRRITAEREAAAAAAKQKAEEDGSSGGDQSQ